MFVILMCTTPTMVYGHKLSDLEVVATDTMTSVTIVDSISPNEFVVADSLSSAYSVQSDETQAWRHTS